MPNQLCGSRRVALVGVLSMLLLAATVVVAAHEMTYQGTVFGVEPARLQVKAIDPASKKEETVWFTVDKSTKVRRGDKTMSYPAAEVVKGERVVVIADHDASNVRLALEIRLAAKK